MPKEDLSKKNPGAAKTLGRRELLAGTVPVCAMACLGMGFKPRTLAAALGGDEAKPDQEVHKFDIKTGMELSSRDITRMQNMSVITLIGSLRQQFGDEEAIRILKEYSAEVGRQTGVRQAQRRPDTTFATFTAQFRPPRYANSMSLEVVEDTENTFELRVTECVWAEVFKEAGLEGEIGHAAVCNMDYHWPPAFNPEFRMERDHTLMQGHAFCNHRYVQETE